MSVASGLSQRNKRPRDQIDTHNVETRGREERKSEGRMGRGRRMDGQGMSLLISPVTLQVLQTTVSIFRLRSGVSHMTSDMEDGGFYDNINKFLEQIINALHTQASISSWGKKKKNERKLSRPHVLFLPADQCCFICRACDNFQFDY